MVLSSSQRGEVSGYGWIKSIVTTQVQKERDFLSDNLLIRIITEMIKRTSLAPWEFEFLFRWPYMCLPRGARIAWFIEQSHGGFCHTGNRDSAVLLRVVRRRGNSCMDTRDNPLGVRTPAPQSLFFRSFTPLTLNAKFRTLHLKPGPTMTRRRRDHHSRK